LRSEREHGSITTSITCDTDDGFEEKVEEEGVLKSFLKGGLGGEAASRRDSWRDLSWRRKLLWCIDSYRRRLSIMSE
jgi:hypothetical protein